jgi:hypothetical protein
MVDDEAHRRNASELAPEAAPFEEPHVDVDVPTTRRDESHRPSRVTVLERK